MTDKKIQDAAEPATEPAAEQYSLNDDRRVKVLSPSAMVAKRFFRNRIAMVGLFVLIAMFAFSFLGGLISPYSEDQLFYRTDILRKEYASAVENTEFRFAEAREKAFPSIVQAQFLLAADQKRDTFTYGDDTYTVEKQGDDFYVVFLTGGDLVGIAYKDVFSLSNANETLSFDTLFNGLKAYGNRQPSFTADGKTYDLAADGIVTLDGKEYGYISRYVVQALMPDVFLTRAFKEKVTESMDKHAESMLFTTEDGEEQEFFLTYNPSTQKWLIRQETESHVYDTYASPSKEHWLGTDGNGMDMLTRLMYGGRVSLMIGFIVEIISTFIGIILGGISGYFGGWIDNLIMRIVDIFYCIPSLPVIIILGAAMDATGVEPKIRMIYLMLLLGLLSWPGLARLIRGQILSLREQEFMTATEACGISVRRRIFRHLIPNVIPQLIVSCTMGLGSTIITEATLSYLGLGVKFPFASWGNIINDVKDTFVLTNYLFIWIPAGVLLLLTVLAFNILGDGLRDAFDPKMKR
ncbi:MAG: ABC transporter permease [Clostridia bacterium]|nr:ABC transporter permease [Clostridia bacterium]